MPSFFGEKFKKWGGFGLLLVSIVGLLFLIAYRSSGVHQNRTYRGNKAAIAKQVRREIAHAQQLRDQMENDPEFRDPKRCGGQKLFEKYDALKNNWRTSIAKLLAGELPDSGADTDFTDTRGAKYVVGRCGDIDAVYQELFDLRLNLRQILHGLDYYCGLVGSTCRK